LLGIVLLAVDCTSAPRLRGPRYGPADTPFLSPHAAAALDREEDPAHRLILIGDAGAPLPDDPTLATLGRWAQAHPDRTTVLFLGDNVYPAGLEDDQRARGEAILRQQLESTRAQKIFIPGNHDWGFSARGSMQTGRLRNEQEFIEKHRSERAEFAPRNGCPGPVAKSLVPPGRKLARGLTVIVVDFHWWLLPEKLRPHCEGIADTEAFLDRLQQELAARSHENVVIAAHHPLRSGGTHGGLTRGFWIDLGAGLYYRLYGPIQDLWEPGYAQMIGIVSEALSEHRPLAFVAGHDHSLQVLEGGDATRLMVVSGAGSAGSLTGVTAIAGTLFAHSHAGFVVLDFFSVEGGSGALLVRVVETGKERPVFTLGLDLEPQVAAQAVPDRGVAPRAR
jgi:hypothetical protein